MFHRQYQRLDSQFYQDTVDGPDVLKKMGPSFVSGAANVEFLQVHSSSSLRSHSSLPSVQCMVRQSTGSSLPDEMSPRPCQTLQRCWSVRGCSWCSFLVRGQSNVGLFSERWVTTCGPRTNRVHARGTPWQPALTDRSTFLEGQLQEDQNLMTSSSSIQTLAHGVP